MIAGLLLVDLPDRGGLASISLSCEMPAYVISSTSWKRMTPNQSLPSSRMIRSTLAAIWRTCRSLWRAGHPIARQAAALSFAAAPYPIRGGRCRSDIPRPGRPVQDRPGQVRAPPSTPPLALHGRPELSYRCATVAFMAVRKKRSISIPPELDAEIAAAAAQAGMSYSAWLADTARKEFTIRAGLAAVSQFEQDHGAFTAEELAEAEEWAAGAAERAQRTGTSSRRRTA